LLFLTFIAMIFCLQFFQRRLLHLILPEGYDHWATPLLLAIHVPLAVFVGFRLAGQGYLTDWLRPLARAGLYFQMLTVLNLFLWLVATVVWRLGHLWRRGFGAPPESPDRRRFLRQTSAAGASLAAYGVVAGHREARNDPEVVRLQLTFADLPAGLDGLRIVQLSDLHAGPLVHLEQLKRWRRMTEAERPELVVITGDIVDNLPEEADLFVTAFKGLTAPLGTYAILGNHDYFTDPRPIWARLEAMGVQFLENRSVILERNGGRMALVGLQDPMARHGKFRDIKYGPGPSPALATRGLAPDLWRLCLNHRPSDFALARQTGARLTLSGHTHGGQVNLIPGLSSALILGRYTAGLYREGDDQLYVSRGLGVVGLPVRIACPPELTVITLRRG
jgi:predicted MPP superfamily phosphohydrolase